MGHRTATSRKGANRIFGSVGGLCAIRCDRTRGTTRLRVKLSMNVSILPPGGPNTVNVGSHLASDEAEQRFSVRTAAANRLPNAVVQGEPVTSDEQRTFLCWHNLTNGVC